MSMYSSAPRGQSQGGGGLRWWDYALALGVEGKTPRQIQNEEEDRARAQEAALRTRARQDALWSEAGIGGGAQAGLSSQAPIPAWNQRGGPAFQGNPDNIPYGPMDEADRLLGVDGQRARQLDDQGAALTRAGLPTDRSAGAPALGGGAPAGGGGTYAGAQGNLLYRADGSPRSYQELMNDRRFIALQMDPEAAGMLENWSNAAKERQAKWEFQNGQYFNVNSDDPLAGSRRAGTAIDANTGMYSDVTPDGRVVTRQSEGFNGVNAARLESDGLATGRAANATRRDYQQIELETAPAITRANREATLQTDLQYNPLIAGRTAQEQARIQLEYNPRIAAETARATNPYELETWQGQNGPVTGSRAQALDAARGGPIQGRSDSTINATNASNSADGELIDVTRGNLGTVGRYAQMLDNGQLNLSLAGNLIDQGRNFIGASSPQSRNFASFKADMARLRNESLRLNTGVQTDQDAARAWEELFANINDEKVVRQRLADIARFDAQRLQNYERRIAGRSAPAQSQPNRRRYNPETGRVE